MSKILDQEEIWETKEEDTKDFLTLALNSCEQDLKAAAELEAEQTENLYALPTDANSELEIDHVANNDD